MSNDRNIPTITIPAELNGDWTPHTLRGYAERQPLNARQVFNFLADAIDEQHPPRMDEPAWGEKVEAGTLQVKERRQYLRWAAADWTRRWVDLQGDTRSWHDLIDPRPVQQ